VCGWAIYAEFLKRIQRGRLRAVASKKKGCTRI